MSSYGKVALVARRLLVEREGLDPREAWDDAARLIFPSSPSCQKKGCPRAAFLGLCEEGLVKGVTRGTYTRSRKNKGYALKAVELLTEDPTLVQCKARLWERVVYPQSKAHNDQMDVVLALWHKRLLLVTPCIGSR